MIKKPVNDFETLYEIHIEDDNYPKFWSCRHKKYLKLQTKLKAKQKYITFSKNKKLYSFSVPNVLARHFLEPPSPSIKKPICWQINGNMNDNRLDNLKWYPRGLHVDRTSIKNYYWNTAKKLWSVQYNVNKKIYKGGLYAKDTSIEVLEQAVKNLKKRIMVGNYTFL